MDADLTELLAHADWLRGLARRLVGPAAADDAVQDTFVAAIHAPPDPDRAARPWLARVLRNVTRMGHRSASRRARREDAVAAIAAPTTGIDDAVARAETFRMLVELVLALDEPYRKTLVRHYFDGDTFATIARRDGIPEATVRGRHKHALERLRARLDAKSRGDRSAWVAALTPIAAPHGAPVLAGVLVMNKLVIAVAALLIAAGLVWKLSPQAKGTTIAAPTPSPVTAAPQPEPRHVTQFASPAARAEMQQQIAAAAASRRGAIAARPMPQLPAPELPSAADLDKQVLRRAMKEVIPFITRCYEDAIPTLGTNHLEIVAKFTVLGDRDVGAIIDAKQLFDANDQPLPAKLDDCLRSTIQTLELPPLGEGSAVEVHYPFSFRNVEPTGSGDDADDDDDELGW